MSLSKAITIGGSFFLYAGRHGNARASLLRQLPPTETRGRTLEEMGKLFGTTDDDDTCTKTKNAQGPAPAGNGEA
jgi:hypothetical protein